MNSIKLYGDCGFRGLRHDGAVFPELAAAVAALRADRQEKHEEDLLDVVLTVKDNEDGTFTVMEQSWQAPVEPWEASVTTDTFTVEGGLPVWAVSRQPEPPKLGLDTLELAEALGHADIVVKKLVKAGDPRASKALYALALLNKYAKLVRG